MSTSLLKPLFLSGGGGSPITAVYIADSSAFELSIPAGSYSAGDKKKFYITPSVQCVLTMASGIVIPSDSVFTSKTLEAGSLYIVQLEYSGAFWMLTTLIGGYTES